MWCLRVGFGVIIVDAYHEEHATQDLIVMIPIDAAAHLIVIVMMVTMMTRELNHLNA
jgi:hypothetical protein